jgi:hypothetical protein
MQSYGASCGIGIDFSRLQSPPTTCTARSRTESGISLSEFDGSRYSPSMGSLASKVGGVESPVEQLAHGFSDLGRTFSTFTQVDHDNPSKGSTSDDNKVEVRRFGDITMGQRFQLTPSMSRNLQRPAREFDVIEILPESHVPCEDDGP